MLKFVHPIAGIVGFLTILAFWVSTIGSELLGTRDLVITVKETIPWGLLILIPSLATAGASGFQISKRWSHRLVEVKKRRMLFIAGNGMFILVPCVLFLASLASRRQFGTLFDAVQVLELAAGATNLILMSLNIMDGLRLTNRLGLKQAQRGAVHGDQ